MQLTGCELKTESPKERARLVEEIRRSEQPVLVLETCQRTECYAASLPNWLEQHSAGLFREAEAFERIARIAAGLESRILGELEIMGQYRNAYKIFHQQHGANQTRLDRVFQQILSLARKARRQSGIDANLTSLSGIAARLLIDAIEPGAPVAVVGSGSLASSTARYLNKRGKSPVRVVSRCPQKAMMLAMEFDGFSAGLDDMAGLFDDVAGIVTATAAPHPLLYPHHLVHARRPLHIVDLGEPADCHSEVPGLEGVRYLGLLDVEKRANVNTEERRQCALVAAQIIRDGAEAWAQRN